MKSRRNMVCVHSIDETTDTGARPSRNIYKGSYHQRGGVVALKRRSAARFRRVLDSLVVWRDSERRWVELYVHRSPGHHLLMVGPYKKNITGIEGRSLAALLEEKLGTPLFVHRVAGCAMAELSMKDIRGLCRL